MEDKMAIYRHQYRQIHKVWLVEDAARVVERREENQRERNRVEEERSHVGDVDEINEFKGDFIDYIMNIFMTSLL